MKIYIVYEKSNSDMYPQKVLVATDPCKVSEAVRAAFEKQDKADAVSSALSVQSAHINRSRMSLSWRCWTEQIEIPAEIRVPTPRGEIIVREQDPEFPGVYVDLLPNGKDEQIPLAIVESNPEQNNDLCVYTYGDAASDEFTHKIVVENI